MKDYLIFIMIIVVVSFFFYLAEKERAQVIKANEKTRELVLEKLFRISSEYGYYEGQKDAINGDTRIEKIYGTDSSYRWSKSPWDGEPLNPLYNPQDGMTVSAEKMVEKIRGEIK
jgi:hypothetical protein